MRKLSKIICLIVLCSFALSTSAGSMLRCCDMSDKTNTQQSPLDTTSKNCHADQKKTSDESSKSCCQYMTLCNGSVLFVSNSPLMSSQINHQVVQFPQDESLVLNTSIPPRRPPKLIN